MARKRASTVQVEVQQPTLTAGDIAKKLFPIANRPDIGTITERIRIWTKEKFLVPVSGYGEGPGKHVRYSEDTVFLAALLNVVADSGLWSSHQRLIADAYTNFTLDRWKRGEKRGETPHLFLVMVHSGTRNTIKLTWHAGISFEDETVTIVINVSKIWAAVIGET